MEDDVNRLLGELKGYMNMDEKPGLIHHICGGITRNGRHEKNQMTRICKRLVRVVYWMENWDINGKKWKDEKEKKEDEWKQYLKCIIGNRVILRILGNKCGAEKIMEVVAGTMGGKGNRFPRGKESKMDCNWVGEAHMGDQEELIGETIDKWLQEERKPKDGITELEQVMQWMECKGDEKDQEEAKQKGTCSNGRIVDLLEAGRSKQLRELVNKDQPATKPADAPPASPGTSLRSDEDSTSDPVKKPESEDTVQTQEGKGTKSSETTSKDGDCQSEQGSDNVENIVKCLEGSDAATIPKHKDINDPHEATAATGPVGQTGPNIKATEEGSVSGHGHQQPGLPGPGAPGEEDPTATKGGTQGVSGPGSTGTWNPGSSGTRSTGTWNPGSSDLGSTGHQSPGSSGPSSTGNQNTGTPRPSAGEGYFFLGKKRRRYKRAHQIRGHPTLEEQLHHVDDQADGPHEYTLVKERKQARSAPTGRMKGPIKRGVSLRRAGRRGVGHRTIIDIHLEVLDECQKVDLHSTKEDFFEVLVQEFMGSKFIEQEDVPKEQVPCSDSEFREGRHCS
ncbi:SICA antigen [Plasmodium coatneyi]|uniref:SICA antigen n=1 Tax=Plasmodium coatneyi TaxID=208452 RepID=A0A1B1E2L9_9APIC|nr:SICA antigen [Plasmodium coatneyi]ANQ09274.1 SICA antigen [Plasmodium coatneyi]